MSTLPELVDRAWFVLQHEPQRKLLGYAVAERFFLDLKMDRVWQRNYASHAEAKLDVTNYFAGFYNCQCLHSVLGNLQPSDYERTIADKEPIVVSEIT